MPPSIPFSTFLRRLSTATTSAAPQTQTQNLERMADELISLTRLELYDYSILFHLKMSLNNYVSAIVASPSSSSSNAAGKTTSAAAAKEKMVFDVKLEKYNAAAKIKEVRGFTDLGLKEAKDLVEKVPAVVKKGVTEEEGNAILEKLKQLGATVVLRLFVLRDALQLFV